MESSNENVKSQSARSEIKEPDKMQPAPFLGGLFSAGGLMGFQIENHKRQLKGGEETQHIYAYPVITYNDNHEAKIDRLKGRFGGRKFGPERNTNSWKWHIKSDGAVELAVLMQGYAPSRAETIAAFQNWRDTEDLAERVMIARELNQAIRIKQISIPKEAYENLVKNPQFLAGVFASRGRLYHEKREDHVSDPIIRMNSENAQLLEAIKERHGGSISPATDKSLLLTIAKADASGFLQIITPYLLSPISEYQKIAATS